MRASKEIGKRVLKDKVLIVGLGNTLAGDDGFGPYMINYLKQQPIPHGVRVMEGGTDAFSMIPYLEQAEFVVLVDVVHSAGAAGTIYRIPLGQLRARGVRLSQHQVSLLDLYQLPYTKWQMNLPDGVLIAIEVGEIETFCEEISPGILAQVPEVAERILAEVRKRLDVELYSL